MSARKAITKKLRFEIFKRDSFTCQYCGEKAPDVVLNIDHLIPVAAGGTNDILNLIAACFSCNSGKSDRQLSDSSVLDKQRDQLELLQARKEQIELMFEWQKGLSEIKNDTTNRLADFWSELLGGRFSLSDTGRAGLKKLERKYSLAEIMEAMRIAVDSYIHYEDDEPTQESVETAWKKVGGICTIRRREAENPDLARIYYIRGILRNRLTYCNEIVALQLLQQAVESDVNIDSLETHAKSARTWTQWTSDIRDFLETQEQNDTPSS